MATYGEGDPTDNAQDFYDWLQENDDEDLSGLNYTVSVGLTLCCTLMRVLQGVEPFHRALGPPFN